MHLDIRAPSQKALLYVVSSFNHITKVDRGDPISISLWLRESLNISHACLVGAWTGRSHVCVEQHMVFYRNREHQRRWVAPR